MSLLDIVELNLARYRANLVIMIPPLVRVIVYLLTLLWRPTFPGAYTDGSQSFLLVGWGTWVLIQAVSFLALLGQASMAGEVVSVEKTSLNDWVMGVRDYFSRVLGVSMIFLVIAGVAFIPISRIYYSVVLLPFASQMSITTPQTTTTTSSTPLSMAVMSMIVILFTSATAVLYMWIAPIVLEKKDVSASLSSGTRAMKKGGRSFLGFIAIMSVTQLVITMIENLPLYLGTGVQLLNQMYLTPSDIATQAIDAVISPLWFLIAFTMYHNISQ